MAGKLKRYSSTIAIRHLRGMDRLKQLVHSLKAEIAELKLKNEELENSKPYWTRTAFRLPKDGQKVIFATHCDEIFGGDFFKGEGFISDYFVDDITFDRHDAINVECWMAMPEFPSNIEIGCIRDNDQSNE